MEIAKDEQGESKTNEDTENIADVCEFAWYVFIIMVIITFHQI